MYPKRISSRQQLSHEKERLLVSFMQVRLVCISRQHRLCFAGARRWIPSRPVQTFRGAGSHLDLNELLKCEWFFQTKLKLLEEKYQNDIKSLKWERDEAQSRLAEVTRLIPRTCLDIWTFRSAPRICIWWRACPLKPPGLQDPLIWDLRLDLYPLDGQRHSSMG